MHRVSRSVVTAVLLAVIGPASALSARAAELRTPDEFFGPRIDAAIESVRPAPLRGDVVHRWNTIAIDASGLDHTPPVAGDPRRFGEQLGPGRSSRAMAIVHVAVFEAVNAIAGGYGSWVGLRAAPSGTSMDAAVAQAAHDTLVSLFPSQATSFHRRLAEELVRVRDWRALLRGVELGHRAAVAVLARTHNDGSDHSEPIYGEDFLASDAAGWWRQDPISQSPVALGAHWGQVRPFVLSSGADFRIPPPPPMNSAAYTAAYQEVKALGGDGVSSLTIRTPDQTETGIYWAYDGTPSLCAPPRLYNQIAVTIADRRGTPMVALARLLALANVAMADTGIAAWESKYHYQLWRPVTGIRESDAGTGPSGTGDGNDDTIGDAGWMPLGAPASNLNGPNFTPPFPAYPSGHAAFGGALFQTLRNSYGTDAIAFTFTSDELNGVTRDNQGNVRPLEPRSFTSLSQAEEENGQSRIYLGIHWSFDKTEGIAQGRRVADYVGSRLFPRR